MIRQYFESFSVGSTLDNLNSELLLSAPVSVPPRQDQERIVGEVEREAASYKQLVGLMRRHANLITERRNALISAAVTGQLEPDSFRACALTT